MQPISMLHGSLVQQWLANKNEHDLLCSSWMQQPR